MVDRRIHGTVSGIVQGVGFRYSARVEAERLGVTGWVRNLPDGRVEFEAEGEEQALERFESWLGPGPAGSVVEDVESTPAPVTGGRGFRVLA